MAHLHSKKIFVNVCVRKKEKPRAPPSPTTCLQAVQHTFLHCQLENQFQRDRPPVPLWRFSMCYIQEPGIRMASIQFNVLLNNLTLPSQANCFLSILQRDNLLTSIPLAISNSIYGSSRRSHVRMRRLVLTSHWHV